LHCQEVNARIVRMKLQNILIDLKKQGIKNTQIRKALIELFSSNTTPLSVTDLLEKLEKNNLKPNKTTIYREIELLKNQAILQEIDFGDGKKRYEVFTDHHHHIRCINCGKTRDITENNNLKFEIGNLEFNKIGFKPISHNLEFFGFCHSCQKLTPN
jgi:Fur family transcriptional regulator, zinc uptake regulator